VKPRKRERKLGRESENEEESVNMRKRESNRGREKENEKERVK
jgi:hypothetical protein